MNKVSKNIIANLEKEFLIKAEEKPAMVSPYSIGIEIEVKWRDYFPELYQKYLLNKSFKELTVNEVRLLTEECNRQEEVLLPILNKVTQCGVNKGADKYWEFSFEPVTDIELLNRQLEILKLVGAIPGGYHSLHITIGGLKPSRDIFYALMIMELLMCTKERLYSAFNKENKKLSSTWAKKGYGGIFIKEANDLKYNSPYAVELRTLCYDTASDFYADMSWLIEALHNIKKKELLLIDNKVIAWNNSVYKLSQSFKNNGLSDVNWKKPNICPEIWENYILNYF